MTLHDVMHDVMFLTMDVESATWSTAELYGGCPAFKVCNYVLCNVQCVNLCCSTCSWPTLCNVFVGCFDMPLCPMEICLSLRVRVQECNASSHLPLPPRNKLQSILHRFGSGLLSIGLTSLGLCRSFVGPTTVGSVGSGGGGPGRRG